MPEYRNQISRKPNETGSPTATNPESLKKTVGYERIVYNERKKISPFFAVFCILNSINLENSDIFREREM